MTHAPDATQKMGNELSAGLKLTLKCTILTWLPAIQEQCVISAGQFFVKACVKRSPEALNLDI